MRLLSVLLSLLFVLTAASSDLLAAKKKRAEPAVERPSYDQPMRVVIVRNSSPYCEPTCPEWIAAEGEIVASTPQAFRKVFKQMGKRQLPVILRSPGGSINAAVEIGQMIRARGLVAGVSNTVYRGCSPFDRKCKLPPERNGIYEGSLNDDAAFCNSACPMVLAGGIERFAGYYTSIGLHEPKTVWTREQLRFRETYKFVRGKKRVVSRKVVSRKVVRDRVTYGLDKSLRKQLTQHYQSLGIDLGILEDTTKAKYSDIHFIAEDRKDFLKIRTATGSAVALATPSVCLGASRPDHCVTDTAREAALKHTLALKPFANSSLVPKMTFRRARLAGADCAVSCPAWIAADGLITAETPKQFENFVNAQQAWRYVVVLNAQGGDMQAAIELGNIIRGFGMQTVIAKSQFVSSIELNSPGGDPATLSGLAQCLDACVLAFAGGTNRLVPKTALVALHHPSAYETQAGSTINAIMMNGYLAAKSVPSKLMSDLQNIKSNDILTLDGTQVAALKLATVVVDLDQRFSVLSCKLSRAVAGCYFAPQETKKAVGAQVN